MARVVLINPGREERFSVQEPLNLGFLASYLELSGVEVKIIDELAGDNVREELANFGPDLVGITATTPLVPRAYQIASLCHDMKIPTIMGGVHASVLPQEALAHVDAVVKGEGEKALLSIVKEGLKEKIVERPFIPNLDLVPPPSRHLMRMDFYLRTKDRLPETYLEFVPPRTKTASLLTSRGCPYSCIFCHNTWRGIPHRCNTPERVVEEIGELISTYKVRAIFFIEDNLFVNKERLKKICQLILKKGYDFIWGGNARVDNIDYSLLKLAREAGCRQLTFGFESGSQAVLDALKKGTRVEENRKAVNLCHQAKILVNGTFMIGNPGETSEDIYATKKFILETSIDSCGVCITTPYPGTELWKWCESKKLIPPSFNWADFTYDKAPIPANENLKVQEIEEVFKEMKEALPLKLSHHAKFGLIHPIKTGGKLFRFISSPSRARRFLKRIKI